MAIGEEKVWIGLSKSGKGIVLTIDENTRYVGNVETLKRMLDGKIKGCPLSVLTPDKK